MSDVDATVPDCVKNAVFRKGKYIIVEDGKIYYQTHCVHNARRENIPPRQFWRLSHMESYPPTQIC